MGCAILTILMQTLRVIRWRLKSPASPLFTQPFIQAQIKENIKASRHWPLCGELTGDRWIPRTNDQLPGNVSIWWRHHEVNALWCFVLLRVCTTFMMTSSNGNIFRVTGLSCGEFANDAELYCFFDLRLNKRLSKQSRIWDAIALIMMLL